MTTTPLKFYQIGSFAVGNRLVTSDERSMQSDADRANALTSGHRACQGCGEALGARYALDTAMRAANDQIIAVNATGCLEVFSTPYPESSWRIAWLHSLFGNAPAVASGVAAALKAKGKTDIRVVGQGGDGATVDIGFGPLSGMFERNDDVLYICYDNEAYMNTGVQRSGATPPAARTARTSLETVRAWSRECAGTRVLRALRRCRRKACGRARRGQADRDRVRGRRQARQPPTRQVRSRPRRAPTRCPRR